MSLLLYVQHKGLVEQKLCADHEVHVKYKVSVVVLLPGNVENGFYLRLTFSATRTAVLQRHRYHNNFLF